MDLFSKKNGHLYCRKIFTDGKQALASSTHLGVGAHPDDLEVMAHHGILHCQTSSHENFFGVTCTTGSGSLDSSEETDLIETRRLEQVESAEMGEFSGCLLLGYESHEIKNGINSDLLSELVTLIKQMKPKVIYSHSPFDKHGTHVGVVLHLIEALKSTGHVPEAFYGCEVWRGLDWLNDEDKQSLAIDQPQKVSQLINCHKSQIREKDYAMATLGRMKANSTFFDSQSSDQYEHQLFAVDLLPLLKDVPVSSWVDQHLKSFRDSVHKNLKGFL